MLLEEKTVIVTGVGTGLGRECAASALREGASVVMAARTKETLDATCAELDPSGDRALAVPADNIRCNMVVPSWMWGPAVKGFVEGKAKHKGVPVDEVVHEIVGKFPLRRMTEDAEVADVAAFFASDLAKAVTGQHLMVNAGEM